MKFTTICVGAPLVIGSKADPKWAPFTAQGIKS